MRRLAWTLLAAFAAAPAQAHEMPGSQVFLAADPQAVTLEAHIPLSELEVAYGRPLSLAALPAEDEGLRAYLAEHIGVTTIEGEAWGETIERLTGEQREDHALLVAHLTFAPPEGATNRLLLDYDAVSHEVMSHYAEVWLGALGENAQPVARLQAPTTTTLVTASGMGLPDPPQPGGAGDNQTMASILLLVMTFAAAATAARFLRRKAREE
jgi:hypothetical protein